LENQISFSSVDYTYQQQRNEARRRRWVPWAGRKRSFTSTSSTHCCPSCGIVSRFHHYLGWYFYPGLINQSNSSRLTWNLSVWRGFYSDRCLEGVLLPEM
jgi:hypothetical protein